MLCFASWSAFALTLQAADKISRMTLVVSSGHEELGGYKAYMNQHGIKIMYLAGKAYIVSNAPTWRVLFFNPVNKKGLEMSLDEWLKHRMQLYYLSIPTTKPNWALVADGTTKFYGYPCKHYLMCRPDAAGHPDKRVDKQREYLLLQSPLVNSIGCRILQHSMELPEGVGVPVSVKFISDDPTYKDAEGGKRVVRMLKTTEVTQQQVSDDFFQYPPHFEPAKREADILNDPTRGRDVESVFYP